MKAAICDDEKIFRDDLIKYLQQMDPELEFHEFTNGKELIRSKMQFDIIFLDIEMPELDGMETAAKLRKLSVGSLIIFLTSHIERVQEAFKVRAFRFLTKPVQPQPLMEALRDAKAEIEQEEKVVINQKGRIYELKLTDIVYIEAYGDGTYIYDNRDNVYECSVQLKEWNNRLEGCGFYKIHKSYIISMRYVNRIVENQLTLEGVPADFTISRRNASAFKEAYLEFVKTNSRLL